jgi:hypothetical protein
VALDHQHRDTPDLDLPYHAGTIAKLVFRIAGSRRTLQAEPSFDRPFWRCPASAAISPSEPPSECCSAIGVSLPPKLPLRQRARSCETPLGNRPRVGPPRSPSSSSDALRSRTVACAPCSRTSESSRLLYAARMSGHTTGKTHPLRAHGPVRAPW